MSEKQPGGSLQYLLAIVVVNFRTPALTIDCLRSLAPDLAAEPRIRVVVVENGSADDSATRIADSIASSGWQQWCSLEISENNRGFSAGNNHGIAAVMRGGGAKYFLLLNSDTIVKPGCLSHCLGIMESNPNIGALSCRLLNADGSTQNVCRRFPTPLRCVLGALSLPWRLPFLFSWADCEDLSWDRDKLARDVDWVGGAFMMLRGEWIVSHKALDERFFFYGEDVEICHRVWRSGLRCYYDPTATVIHLGGGSSDPGRMKSDARNYHAWRGRYLIQEICYGRLARLCVQSVDVLRAASRVVWTRVTGRADLPESIAAAEVLRLLIRNFNKWGRSET